jgi:hypothetical protein
MAKDHRVTIAGKEYQLRYRLSDRQEIEAKFPGRGLFHVMFSGALREQVTVLWAGMKSSDRRLTVSAVESLLEDHVEQGGDYMDDVIRVAYRAVFDSRLLGRADEEGVRRLLGFEDEGKEAAQS